MAENRMAEIIAKQAYKKGRQDFANELYDRLDKESPVFPVEFNDGYYCALRKVQAIIKEIK